MNNGGILSAHVQLPPGAYSPRSVFAIGPGRCPFGIVTTRKACKAQMTLLHASVVNGSATLKTVPLQGLLQLYRDARCRTKVAFTSLCIHHAKVRACNSISPKACPDPGASCCKWTIVLATLPTLYVRAVDCISSAIIPLPVHSLIKFTCAGHAYMRDCWASLDRRQEVKQTT